MFICCAKRKRGHRLSFLRTILHFYSPRIRENGTAYAPNIGRTSKVEVQQQQSSQSSFHYAKFDSQTTAARWVLKQKPNGTGSKEWARTDNLECFGAECPWCIFFVRRYSFLGFGLFCFYSLHSRKKGMRGMLANGVLRPKLLMANGPTRCLTKKADSSWVY